MGLLDILNPLSPLINAGTQLAGSAFNFFQQKDTNKQQLAMMREQNVFNESMVDKMNEYNSYANQKQLMMDAGLNPAFLFGSGSIDATQGSAASGASVPQLQAPQFDVSSPSRALFEATRLQNETLKNQADIDKIVSESESFKIANKQAEERFQTEMAKIKADTSLSDADKNLRIEQLQTEKAKQIELAKSAENLSYNMKLLQQKAITEQWSQKKMSKEIDRITRLTPIEAKELESRYHVNEAQAKVLAETLHKIKSEITTMLHQGRLIDAQAMSQMLDNQLKDAKIGREVEQELLKNESPVSGIIFDETNGMIGDILKFVAAMSLGFNTEQTPSSSKKRSKEFRYNRTNTSWLFE